MLYYLGKGTEFKKEDCKEYKKLDAALRAAAKDESLVVWDISIHAPTRGATAILHKKFVYFYTIPTINI